MRFAFFPSFIFNMLSIQDLVVEFYSLVESLTNKQLQGSIVSAVNIECQEQMSRVLFGEGCYKD